MSLWFWLHWESVCFLEDDCSAQQTQNKCLLSRVLSSWKSKLQWNKDPQHDTIPCWLPRFPSAPRWPAGSAPLSAPRVWSLRPPRKVSAAVRETFAGWLTGQLPQEKSSPQHHRYTPDTRVSTSVCALWPTCTPSTWRHSQKMRQRMGNWFIFKRSVCLTLSAWHHCKADVQEPSGVQRSWERRGEGGKQHCCSASHCPLVVRHRNTTTMYFSAFELKGKLPQNNIDYSH